MERIALLHSRESGSLTVLSGAPAEIAAVDEKQKPGSSCGRTVGRIRVGSQGRNDRLPLCTSASTTLVLDASSYLSRSTALDTIGNDGRSRTHRHLEPLGWGPKGRWFKSSRPDFSLVLRCFGESNAADSAPSRSRLGGSPSGTRPKSDSGEDIFEGTICTPRGSTPTTCLLAARRCASTREWSSEATRCGKAPLKEAHSAWKASVSHQIAGSRADRMAG